MIDQSSLLDFFDIEATPSRNEEPSEALASPPFISSTPTAITDFLDTGTSITTPTSTAPTATTYTDPYAEARFDADANADDDTDDDADEYVDADTLLNSEVDSQSIAYPAEQLLSLDATQYAHARVQVQSPASSPSLAAPSSTSLSASSFTSIPQPVLSPTIYQATSFDASSSYHGPIPHQGGLCRIEGSAELTYTLDVLLQDLSMHQLNFTRKDFDFATRLFAIMDTESRGQISMSTVKEFVTMRCPVFWRRDEDLEHGSYMSMSAAPPPMTTFDEVWQSVIRCSQIPRLGALDMQSIRATSIGVEAWMVFCRFIALAQYLEAKRRFSGRHLQQTMRHRNAPRGSEVVMVDVPPAAPPLPLSADQLANYERTVQKSLPLPELDLDHSLLAAHDMVRRRKRQQHLHSQTDRSYGDNAPHFVNNGRVEIQLFGSSLATRKALSSVINPSSTSNTTEFRIAYFRYSDSANAGIASPSDIITVRRSMEDMKWLHDTFQAHKALGGTLCGRILPPFPGTEPSKFLGPKLTNEESALASTGGAAIAAASIGVGKLKKGLKSLWGTYVSSSAQGLLSSNGSSLSTQSSPSSLMPNSSSPKTLASPQHKKRVMGRKGTKPLPDNYYNPNTPDHHARQFERYLNYLLEHPALSASFPLNTILKASQSGLVAAKQSLEEHGRAQRETTTQMPGLMDGNNLPFWPLTGSASASQMNVSWIRTAAQAAIALKIHGVLETSGLQSASARLQHASLPNYEHARITKWPDEDSPKRSQQRRSMTSPHGTTGNGNGIGTGDGRDHMGGDIDGDVDNSFEDGVLHVDDELEHQAEDDDEGSGYDLLPLPVPAPERAILNTGDLSSERQKPKEGRYRYGSPSLSDHLLHDDERDSRRSAFIGDIAVDENIDKLREVIGSVDSTLSRCLASSAEIGSARRKCNDLHLGIVQGFDSWEGLRGKFVSQRALLKGVTGMEQAINVFEDSDLSIVDDMSWQTALAHSAVSAAEDVRSTVRAARTATNAKAAAVAAADSAQCACEEDIFASMDEARATQTRASIAKSHALQSAVVEHEALAVKRRATMALAHDVKCWNGHRKREVLRMCLAHAKSQHEATRRAVDAWSCLRDGFIGSTAFPTTQSRWIQYPESQDVASFPVNSVHEDSHGTIYDTNDEAADQESDSSPKLIVPVEHDLLKVRMETPSVVDAEFVDTYSREPDTILPLVVASPIPEEGEEEDDEEEGKEEAEAEVAASEETKGNESLSQSIKSIKSANTGSVHAGSMYAGSILSNSVATHSSSMHGFRLSMDSQQFSAASVTGKSSKAEAVTATAEDDDPLTESMLSLVDGLMAWGGQYDTEEDMALPTGMAASIALEESGVLGSQADL